MNSKSVYIIAEAGVNHNGQRNLAFDLVKAAAESGADAVKFQTFKATKLASHSLEKATYQKKQTGEGESQLDMLRKLELPEAWHVDLQRYAKENGIVFLSTAFDEESLAFLQTLDMPLFKLPSGELTNGPLLWQFARTGKPLVMSTGMATLAEVEQALAIVAHGLSHARHPANMDEVWLNWMDERARQKLHGHVTLLHCTSQYPTPWSEVNLNAMGTLAAAFGLPVGYSDHTEGTLIPIAAVARGAVVIEKHFTLDKNMPGPDHKASLEVQELKQMVKDIRALEQAFGTGIKAPQASEWEVRKLGRQTVIAAKKLVPGQIIQQGDFTTARAGKGESPCLLWELPGTAAKKIYEPGEVLEI